MDCRLGTPNSGWLAGTWGVLGSKEEEFLESVEVLVASGGLLFKNEEH